MKRKGDQQTCEHEACQWQQPQRPLTPSTLVSPHLYPPPKKKRETQAGGEGTKPYPAGQDTVSRLLLLINPTQALKKRCEEVQAAESKRE